jgi:hypothetical protein
VIARLVILLPFDLLIREGDVLPPVDLNQPERTFRFYPPSHYVERPNAAGSVMAPIVALREAKVPAFSDSSFVGGRRIAQVNVLVLDIFKQVFDRLAERATNRNPDIEAAFEFANSMLARIRVYSRSFQIKPLQIGHDPWRVTYLTDDGQQLAHEEGKIRFLTGAFSVIGRAAVTNESIQLVVERQTTEEPFAWDNLLLDAYALLPDVGSAIVMASAALEVFISWALSALHAEQQLPNQLWTWINERDHWSKEPSVAERFDVLLRVFTGRSLKDDARLWQKFVELRKSRNALVHQGTAQIGPDVVTTAKAQELVGGANEIIKWVELLLPQSRRRAQTEAAGPFARKMATVDESLALGFDASETVPPPAQSGEAKK